MQVSTEQFSCEKARLKQAAADAESQAHKLQDILKGLDQNHKKQMKMTLGHIERMKNSLYQSRVRQTESHADTRTYVAELNSVQSECQQTEQEIQIVVKEIEELNEENRALKVELAKLNSVVYNPAN